MKPSKALKNLIEAASRALVAQQEYDNAHLLNNDDEAHESCVCDDALEDAYQCWAKIVGK